MEGYIRNGLAAAAGFTLIVLPLGLALGAVGEVEPQVVAEAQVQPARFGTADVELKFVQEDGPSSGHIRVDVTPAIRALNAFEARSAAQQAFLATLDEPGLGDDLKRIRVVVYLAPRDTLLPQSQSFLFHRTGAKNWSIRAAE